MKKVILLFVFFLFLLGNSVAQWTVVNTGTSSMYESIYFFDATHGIASSTNDVIKTSNGGSSWTVVNTPGIRDIDFANSSVGYAAGLNGTSLYKSADGGNTWTSLTPIGNNILWGVSVVDANTVYVCGTNGAVWKTTNGGVNFTAVNISTNNTIIDLQFLNSNVGCALEVTGNVWRTTNGGASWSIVYASFGVYFSSIYFADSNVGFAVGSNGTIIRTLDGGATWDQLTTNSAAYFQYVYFYDDNNGIVVGLNGAVFHTTDGGYTWYDESPTTSLGIYSCILLSPTSAIVGGINGLMAKNSALITGLDLITNENDFSIYPTPANDWITIDFNASQMSDYFLSIFNSFGQIVFKSELISLNKEIDISGLVDGVYYLRIEDKENMFCKKILKQ